MPNFYWGHQYSSTITIQKHAGAYVIYKFYHNAELKALWLVKDSHVTCKSNQNALFQYR